MRCHNSYTTSEDSEGEWELHSNVYLPKWYNGRYSFLREKESVPAFAAFFSF